MVAAAAFAMALQLLGGTGNADELLTVEGTVPNLNAQGPTRLIGNVLYVISHQRLVAVDVETRQATEIADDLPDVRILAASDRKIAVGSNKADGNLIVFDRLDRSRVPLCCFTRALSGYFVGEKLHLVYDGGSAFTIVHTVDLANPTAPEHRSLSPGVATNWQDRMLLVSQYDEDASTRSVVTILGSDFAALGSANIPDREMRGDRGCPADAPVADGPHLIYVSNCGQIAIVDLEQKKFLHLLPYFSAATAYSLALSGRVGFAAPRGTSEPVLAFDLASGRQLATLPVSAAQIWANDRYLIAIHAGTYPDPNIDIYKINAAAIEDVSASVAAVVSRIEREVAALLSGGTVQSALSAIESKTVAPLFDHLDTADPRTVDAATAYARLLARTVDRIPEGIALLERLADRAPDPAAITAYLAAAKARQAIRLGETPSAGLAALAPGTEERSLAGDLTISKDRVYILGGAPAGTRTICATVRIYDRATLHEQSTATLPGCDDDDGGFEDSVTGLAEGDDTYIALEYRFEQAGRTDLFVLKKRDPARVEHYALLGSIEDLAVTPEGLLACGPGGGPCAVFDPQNLEGKSEPTPSLLVFCQPNGTAFPNVPAPPAVSQRRTQGESITFCDGRFFAVDHSNGEQRSATLYDVAAPERPIAELPDDLTGLSEEAGLAVASESRDGQITVRSARLTDGRVRPELKLAVDPVAQITWAMDRNVLFVARGRDLLVYDLTAGSVLDYLTRIVPEPTDDRNGYDTHRIMKLVVDQAMDRLIVLTADGHHSRAIPLASFLANLRNKQSPWRQADAALAGD